MKKVTSWSIGSYSVRDGRAESSFGSGGNAQIDQAKAKGQNGAPGVDAAFNSKSSSADPGRRKWPASSTPQGDPR